MTETIVEAEKEKKCNTLLVHRRLSHALMEEKHRLEQEGYEVPGTTLSVRGDDRLPWQPEKYFSKTYGQYLRYIQEHEGLNVTEMGIIFILIQHIGYESSMLVKDNGEPITKKDWGIILKLGQNAVDKHIAALVRKGILAKVKVKRNVHYYLDPRIAYQGNRIDTTLLSLFRIDPKTIR